jgi:hypothetical protein
MNFQWTRSDNFLLVPLTIAAALVGVLTTVVIHQQHDQLMVDEQIRLRTGPTVPTATVPAGANIAANPNAVTHPDPATTPDSANAAVAPASQPAPAFPAPPVAPALVAPTPLIIAPPQLAPSFHKPLKPKMLPHRRVGPVLAPPPSVAAHPVTPTTQTDPGTATKSDTPVKPGSPDGNW